MRCKLHLIRSRLAGNKRPKTSLRAWSRLTAHYQVLPCSHQYYRVRPTPSSSHPLFSQSHPWKDRQKSFICSKNTTVKREERRGEERRLCFDRRDKGGGRTKTLPSLPYILIFPHILKLALLSSFQMNHTAPAPVRIFSPLGLEV